MPQLRYTDVLQSLPGVEVGDEVTVTLAASPTKTQQRTATVIEAEPPFWVPDPLRYEFGDESFTLAGQTDYWLFVHSAGAGDWPGIENSVVKLAWKSHPRGAPVATIEVSE